jgi:serine/threonine-protein kinase
MSPTADRDERLAQLLAELADDARRGRAPDLDAVAAAHPDLAGELRELWATAQFADAFAPRSAPRVTEPHSPPPAPTAALLPRTFGDYDLLEEIGHGGMGIVYKARQKSLQRTVALKMILRGELARPEDRARFQAEAEAAAQLHHPNIVPVFEAGAIDGQAFFSMRHIEGRTLASTLGQPLRPREAARLLLPVCRAVQHAHERGILHRDLKPSNVLLDAASEPHVTDFGLARQVANPDRLTAPGAILGTPTYMAPEQVSGSRGPMSPASDVYSLGVILYEMLTGRPPFQAATPVDTLLLVLDQDPVRPRLLNRKVDPDLELICLKCIEKEAELRYAGAGELAADLAAYLNGEELSVRAVGLRDLWALFRRSLRETPHAVVLENWGLLWMCHSATIFVMCVLTWGMSRWGVDNPWWYLLLWGGGLIVWGSVFWGLRKRGGPVLFVERQVAHVWAGAVIATISVFLIEVLLGLRVLTLSPVLAVIAGVVFTVKAGMLSGAFYPSAAALFLTAVPMALFPEFGPLLFGIVSAVCFFVPGLKYHLRRRRASRA